MKNIFNIIKYKYFKAKFNPDKSTKEDLEKKRLRITTAILYLKDNDSFNVFWNDILVENYLDAVYNAAHKGSEYDLGCVDTWEFLLNLLETTIKDGGGKRKS